ncbi:TetR family transcriptional regulator [Nonomuraea gerenzanensis]|uniref:Transcriptional regulator, TetR family n=1 Tax=Nonomuraea gerenzanensis TaxID=93944 RepID=A0A1M4E5T7_9ACTN|nr:TetR family transcriptional regulator [Nonomuraea gerenzanensis]UBU16341.1 TetR family transcriptional regulator [Nonomuraea gerenzanensis]SBO94160.1 Transcriptional regulator, TetR family [Nonomuraea gerenzanensis]
MTSERILEAARVLFAARGYRATSMQAIADEVGITKAALYYHFDSKEEILRHITVPLLDELEEALAGAESGGSAEEVRWRAIEGYVDVHLRHRHTLTMLVKDMTLLVQAPIADRFRTAIALANELVAGPSRGIEGRVRACQVVAGLADPVLLFRDEPPERLRRLILDGARALLDAPGDMAIERGRARGRNGGRRAVLTEEQVAQARSLHAEGLAAEEIAARFGVSRATVYRYLKN